MSSLLRDEIWGFPHTLTRGIYTLLEFLDVTGGLHSFALLSVYLVANQATRCVSNLSDGNSISTNS